MSTQRLRLGLLYLVLEDADCGALLAAMRYLHAEHGVAALPDKIIERHIPGGMALSSVRLPDGTRLRGLPTVTPHRPPAQPPAQPMSGMGWP